MSTPTPPIGDLTLGDAWSLLTTDADAVLIDVRTTAEWQFVGTPDLSSLGKAARLVEWTTWPGGAPNPGFIAEATVDLTPEQPILLLCRSGARSLAAAQALAANGYPNVHNVVAGFEGDLDGDTHRHGGWKDELPWTQG